MEVEIRGIEVIRREFFLRCREEKESSAKVGLEEKVEREEGRSEVVEEATEEVDMPAEVSKAMPGDIHRSEVRPFWESLQPEPWVKAVLNEGYKIPFAEEVPESYEEENNATAKKHFSFVQEHVQTLVERGVVRRSQDRPRCINPLTVATKEVGEGQVKYRLCLDLSRCVNPRVKREHCKLTTFKAAVSLMLPGDFQAVYDLASAYHHVRMHLSLIHI